MNRTALLHFVRQSAQAVPSVVAHLDPAAQAAIKAAGDLEGINAVYHDAISQSLITYFEGGSITAPKNSFKRATVVAFTDAFFLGYMDGGGNIESGDEELNAWLDARINSEFGFIDMLFQEAKELRKEKDFDYFTWATARADSYTNTLRGLYNNGRLRAAKDRAVTFVGDDGAASCDTCRSLKDKRHKISWFVARNYVPPFGTGLDCHRGGHCQHYLIDDNGEQVTI